LNSLHFSARKVRSHKRISDNQQKKQNRIFTTIQTETAQTGSSFRLFISGYASDFVEGAFRWVWKPALIFNTTRWLLNETSCFLPPLPTK